MIRAYAPRTKLHDMLDRVRMTQRMLAYETGSEQSAVSLWLNGKRLPLDDKIERMAQVLDVEKRFLKAVFIAENLYHNDPELCSSISRILAEITEERDKVGTS